MSNVTNVNKVISMNALIAIKFMSLNFKQVITGRQKVHRKKLLFNCNGLLPVV